jgi:hypothetical protein
VKQTIGQNAFDMPPQNIIDSKSEMQASHQLHIKKGLADDVEMSVIMMKVDIKKGSYYGVLRYYIA